MNDDIKDLLKGVKAVEHFDKETLDQACDKAVSEAMKSLDFAYKTASEGLPPEKAEIILVSILLGIHVIKMLLTQLNDNRFDTKLKKGRQKLSTNEEIKTLEALKEHHHLERNKQIEQAASKLCISEKGLRDRLKKLLGKEEWQEKARDPSYLDALINFKKQAKDTKLYPHL